jgi:hypothetical protein
MAGLAHDAPRALLSQIGEEPVGGTGLIGQARWQLDQQGTELVPKACHLQQEAVEQVASLPQAALMGVALGTFTAKRKSSGTEAAQRS